MDLSLSGLLQYLPFVHRGHTETCKIIGTLIYFRYLIGPIPIVSPKQQAQECLYHVWSGGYWTDILNCMTPLSFCSPSLFMEKIKEPQQSAKHVGLPSPTANIQPTTSKATTAFQTRIQYYGSSTRKVFIFVSFFTKWHSSNLRYNAQHGTKWKPK